MQKQLTKIPSALARLNLPASVEISEQIVPEEGAVLLVEALADAGKNNLMEYTSGRIGFLVEGDILPVVLGKRRALREYSGDIPTKLAVGDILYYLCESGVVGEIKGLNEQWGLPMQVKVLGSVVTHGKQLNMKDVAVPKRQLLENSAPIIGVVGTCMNIGKTTTICKLIKHFKARGLQVAGVKLSGVASTQDLDKIRDAGAYPVLGFMDGGLPSTCNDAKEVVEAALGIIHEVNQSQPDLIIAEFGDGILGEYNVGQLISNPEIQQHISSFIVGAGDLVSAWGAKEIMQQYGAAVTLITGPAVNNDTGVQYVEKHFKVPAESNLHAMPKTIGLIEAELELFKTERGQAATALS
jgi:methylmalonyl-CoA mutase cobalamin-binding subunit